RVRNPGTRDAYLRAVRNFLAWCAGQGIAELRQVRPPHVAAYIELLGRRRSAPTVKRALAAIRSLFDHLASGGLVTFNPAAPVRGPRHVVVRGSTPVLTVDEARQLLASIPGAALIDLRDRALIGTMVFTFARISAAVQMRSADYFQQGRRWFVRLHEKNGRLHQVPAHPRLQDFMEAYLLASGLSSAPDVPLFLSCTPAGAPTGRAMSRHDALRMVKRRAVAAGLSPSTCCHSFRATGITAYLANGGLLETAQMLAGHASARTTSLYDRRRDTVGAGEIERINI
ncbi:MAG: site-specific integrase, partial [Phycisphaerales bacterium]|nr:site-specific integrase [Phycisphaerales bacterium]